MIRLFGWVLMRASEVGNLKEVEGELRFCQQLIEVHKECNDAFAVEVKELEERIVELDANEFSMRMRMEQVEKELENNESRDSITIENLRSRIKNLEVMNDEYVCAAVKENNKVEELEDRCMDYINNKIMYEALIEKQQNKSKKLEAKIIKLKERR